MAGQNPNRPCLITHPHNPWRRQAGGRLGLCGNDAQPPETRVDYRGFIAKHPGVPVISHEIGQWCVYPNFEEIPKYAGCLKPKNFEIFRETLIAHHMGDQARDFLIASGKLQTLCYKEEIESALRTPGMGGFQLLDLHDFPGQGTALVGVPDPFWESKGYVTPAEYSRFCNSTVPLARLSKRVFTTDEKLEADIAKGVCQLFLTDSGGRCQAHFRRKWCSAIQVCPLSHFRKCLPSRAPLRFQRQALQFYSLPILIPQPFYYASSFDLLSSAQRRRRRH